MLLTNDRFCLVRRFLLSEHPICGMGMICRIYLIKMINTRKHSCDYILSTTRRLLRLGLASGEIVPMA